MLHLAARSRSCRANTPRHAGWQSRGRHARGSSESLARHRAVGSSAGPAGVRMIRLILAATILLSVSPASARDCTGNRDALGTARELVVDARTTPRVGRKHFAATLPLAPKEVVLTFDDGPWPGTTERVLDALARECVKATFFLVGQRAQEAPALVRREHAEGHTVAHHTWSHALLDRRPLAAAEAEIDRGFAAVDTALYGRADRAPAT